MKIFCSFSTVLRFACWVAVLCLVAGVALGHAANPAPASPAAVTTSQ
ncbi:hypothetical protein [Amycolatopsis sp. GM8]|nr:hypothetical protein [Amycolatopsis sp. GM8]